MNKELYDKIIKDAETKTMTVRQIKDIGIDSDIFHFGENTKFVTFEFFERTIDLLCEDL